MSAVRQARQRTGLGWRAAALPGRVLHAALRLALVLLAVAVLGAAALSWRLAQGPLDVAWLARRVEAAAFPADAPTHLAVGAASIAWNGFRQGADRGLEVRLRDLQLVDRGGMPIARLDQADATVSLLRLLQLQVVPRAVALTGARLRAVRDPGGAITFDLGGLDSPDTPSRSTVTLADIVAELRQPAGTDRPSGAGLHGLAQLQHVTLHGADIQVRDEASGKTLRVELADLDGHRQPGGGVKGVAAGRVALGDAEAALRVTADLLPNGGTHLDASLAPTQAGPLAQSSPTLAALGAVDASVQAHALLDLSPAFAPRSGAIHLASGAGAIAVARGTLAFERLALDATMDWPDRDATWRPSRLAVQRAQLVLPSGRGAWPTTLAATARADRADGMVTAAVDVTLDHVEFADLGTLWPAAWGGNVRPWLVQNVTAGTARDGAVTFKLAAPENDLADVDLVAAGGTLQGEDVTIHWLRPVPPVEHAQARLTVIGPDVIEIAIPGATQGPIALKDGLLRFTGLAGREQVMALGATVQGQVADVLQLLRHPRLKLLDRRPVPIRDAAGTLASKLAVELPMKKDIDADQLGIAAQGRVAGLRLAGLVAGRDIERGDIRFDVNQDGLKASGPVTVAGIVGAAEVAMDFRVGPPSQVLQRATVSGRSTAAQLAAAGINVAGLVTSGAALLTASYAAQRDGAATIDVKGDFAPAALAFAGWRKPAGPEASAAATILLRNDKLAGIRSIEAQGPGLSVSARAEMVGDRPLLLRLDRVVLGPTRASGEVRFAEANGPTRVRLAGPVLDLSTELSAKHAQPSRAEPGDAWVADLQFERILLARGKFLSGVTGHLESDGRLLRAANVQSTGPEQAHAIVAPQGAGRHVSVRAADAGVLLQALDITDTIHGGALVLDAQSDDRAADPPLVGTLDLGEFEVRDAVIVGKLLQAITIYGIVDAVRGEGVQFGRLMVPFRYDRRQLHIGESRAYSASLGLTASGWIDFARNIMDVRGTIVPAYAINSALGRVPLVGRLFSPERGGGLVAVNYAVSGRAGDPKIAVNPLSALTPGFLRGLFNIFS